MSSYHKALTNLVKCDPVFNIQVRCSTTDEKRQQNDQWIASEFKFGRGDEFRCWYTYELCEYLYTKHQHARSVQEEGWIYDELGNWWCPACVKCEKEREGEGK